MRELMGITYVGGDMTFFAIKYTKDDVLFLKGELMTNNHYAAAAYNPIVQSGDGGISYDIWFSDSYMRYDSVSIFTCL